MLSHLKIWLEVVRYCQPYLCQAPTKWAHLHIVGSSRKVSLVKMNEDLPRWWWRSRWRWKMSSRPLYSRRENPKCVGEPGFEKRWWIRIGWWQLWRWYDNHHHRQSKSVQGWLWAGDWVASSEEGRSLAKSRPAWESRRCWCWLSRCWWCLP